MTAERWDNAGTVAELCRLLARGSNAARTKAGRRKLRLAGCGCCRAVWAAFGKDRARAGVEAAERFADGRATTADAEAAARRVWWGSLVWSRADRRAAAAVRALLTPSPIWVSARAGDFLLTPTLDDARGCSADEARRRFAVVFRCVFASPFRPAAFDPRWRTAAAVGLAEAIEADGAFDRLPILADALEEAGCDDANLLAHCRGDGPHARGCRAVDAVLKKG